MENAIRQALRYFKRIGAQVEFVTTTHDEKFYATTKGDFRLSEGKLSKFDKRLKKDKWEEIFVVG